MTKKIKSKNKKTKMASSLPVWATFFTIIGILILCGLGTWQLQRLEQKEALIAKIDAATAIDPMSHRFHATEFINAERQGIKFISGHIVGRYLHKDEIILGPRTYEGLSGYHVITPVILEDGGTILVNRGWVPDDKKEQESRPASLIPGTTVITGIARPPEEKGTFTPENKPEAGKWYWLDMKAIAKEHNLVNVMPYILYLQSSNFQMHSFPRPLNMTWKPANNHMGYAIFWFTMAFILGIFYYLRFIRKAPA